MHVQFDPVGFFIWRQNITYGKTISFRPRKVLILQSTAETVNLLKFPLRSFNMSSMYSTIFHIWKYDTSTTYEALMHRSLNSFCRAMPEKKIFKGKSYCNQLSLKSPSTRLQTQIGWTLFRIWYQVMLLTIWPGAPANCACQERFRPYLCLSRFSCWNLVRFLKRTDKFITSNLCHANLNTAARSKIIILRESKHRNLQFEYLKIMRLNREYSVKFLLASNFVRFVFPLNLCSLSCLSRRTIKLDSGFCVSWVTYIRP